MTRRDYLAFGGTPDRGYVDSSATLSFLRDHGFDKGALAQARRALSDESRQQFTFEAFGSGFCDFCFAQLMGGEFEELQDGRQRCTRCSRSVIGTEDAFRHEFEYVRRNMEVAFGISLSVPMMLRMVNAKEIARRTGEEFFPTPFVNPRVLGFMEAQGNARALYIENGSPRMAAVTTIAHELTHVWQDINWQRPDIEQRYGAQNFLPVSEGMAVWAQIQYLLHVREFSYAQRQLAYALIRDDEYGLGFRVFLERYPLSEDGQPGRDSPFLKPLPL